MRNSPPLELAVFGTTSSGKSTFLNALVGDWLLPAQVQEMTTGTTLVRHHAGQGHALLYGDESTRYPDRILQAQSALEVRDAFEAEMRTSRETLEARGTGVTPHFMCRWPTYAGEWLTEKLGRPVALDLIDNPGLKSESDSQNALRVRRSSSLNVILLGADETDLNKLGRMLRKVLEQIEDPRALLFVINKADALALDRDPAASIRKVVREFSHVVEDVWRSRFKTPVPATLLGDFVISAELAMSVTRARTHANRARKFLGSGDELHWEAATTAMHDGLSRLERFARYFPELSIKLDALPRSSQAWSETDVWDVIHTGLRESGIDCLLEATLAHYRRQSDAPRAQSNKSHTVPSATNDTELGELVDHVFQTEPSHGRDTASARASAKSSRRSTTAPSQTSPPPSISYDSKSVPPPLRLSMDLSRDEDGVTLNLVASRPFGPSPHFLIDYIALPSGAVLTALEEFRWKSERFELVVAPDAKGQARCFIPHGAVTGKAWQMVYIRARAMTSAVSVVSRLSSPFELGSAPYSRARTLRPIIHLAMGLVRCDVPRNLIVREEVRCVRLMMDSDFGLDPKENDTLRQLMKSRSQDDIAKLVDSARLREPTLTFGQLMKLLVAVATADGEMNSEESDYIDAVTNAWCAQTSESSPHP